MIKILIADDQALFREALRTLISLQPDFEVVGEAANGAEACALVQRLSPAVVLMDLQMPVVDGVTATRRLHAEQPDCRVIALTRWPPLLALACCSCLRAWMSRSIAVLMCGCCA